MDWKHRWLGSMQEIAQPDWARLTQKLKTPILDWEWLDHLERSGSITADTGWTPRHLVVFSGDELVAAAPLYLKTHSWGEFVYDFGFAEAAPQLGRSWYPKLVGMSPVTPSVGYQFLIADGIDRAAMTEFLLTNIDAWCRAAGVVSLQFNFVDQDFRDQLAAQGCLAWTHQHYHFSQADGDFEAYLARFDKNQRRNIRREVASMTAQGLRFEVRAGAEVPPTWYGLMGELYERTNDKFGPWAAKFLEPAFFHDLQRIQHQFCVAAAFRGDSDQPLALSFMLRRGQTLIGRYWGSREELPDLYFNLCYYEPIRWALAQGITDFDPGAGSSLKIRRGFVAKPNWSLHRFYDRSLERLFRHYLPQFNRHEEAQIQSLNAGLPFKAQDKTADMG